MPCLRPSIKTHQLIMSIGTEGYNGSHLSSQPSYRTQTLILLGKILISMAKTNYR